MAEAEEGATPTAVVFLTVSEEISRENGQITGSESLRLP